MKIQNIIIFVIITLSLLDISYAMKRDDKCYILSIGYDKGVITYDRLNLANKGCESKLSNFGNYSINLISIKEDILYETKFDFDFRTWDAQPNFEQSFVVLSIPYYSEANQMKVYYKDELKLTVNTTEFLRCNLNNICEVNMSESKFLCPEDCGSGFTINKWHIIIGILVIVLIILIIITIKKKR